MTTGDYKHQRICFKDEKTPWFVSNSVYLFKYYLKVLVTSLLLLLWNGQNSKLVDLTNICLTLSNVVVLIMVFIQLC